MLEIQAQEIVDNHTVTVSPKFQVVIPKEIREAMKEIRGFLKGIDTEVARDSDRV